MELHISPVLKLCPVSLITTVCQHFHVVHANLPLPSAVKYSSVATCPRMPN